MKKTIRRLVLANLLLVFTFSLSAQSVTLNFENVSLKVVFASIKKQTGLNFSYSTQLVNPEKTVSISVINESVETVIKQLLNGTNLTFEKKEKNILLFEKPKPIDDKKAPESKKITGLVTDEKGDPIIGASIVLKGFNTGTITNIDGIFALEAPQQSQIIISYIGFKQQILKVSVANNYKIILGEDLKVLDEIIVVGYGSIKAKEMTSAISHVSSKDFLNISSTNPIMQIQGKVASLSISNTAAADPNSNASVQVRGVSSRNADLGPLYVVDGVTDVNMQNVNSNDIESIDVLKDGAASAIYGTRGSNGVIVVTTKKGNRDGKTHISYNGFLSIDKINNKPNLLTAAEFREFRVPDGGVDFGASTDWFDAVTRTGVTQNHTLSISAGTAKFNARATVDTRNSTGIDIRSDRKEYGARITFNLGAPEDVYKFSVNVAPRVVNLNRADQGALDIAMRSNPTFAIMNPDNPLRYNDFMQLPTGPNPVETLKLIQSGTEAKMLDWNGTASINLLSLINPSLNTSGNTLRTQITFAQNIADNFDYSFSPSTVSTNIFYNIKGTAGRTYSKAVNQSLEYLITGSYKYLNHSLNLVGGYSYNYFVNSSLSANNRNFASDALTYNNLGNGDNEALLAGNMVNMATSKFDSKLIGFFGRLSYNYLDKYLFTASIRNEGSSKFGFNNRWGLFPAVSAGWRISDEAFMKDVSWVNDLKIRADYGVTGNQGIPNYKSLALYSTFGSSYYNGEYIKIVGPSTNINPDLRWEKGLNWNIGVDFSIFKNILSGSVNYYNRTQVDLVGDYKAPVPPNITPLIFANVGSMKNSGLEAELQIKVLNKAKFNYSINFSGEINDNKFMNFSNDVYKGKGYDDAAMLNLGDFGLSGVPVQRIQEGQRVGMFYMLAYAGIDDNGKWLVWNADNTDKIPLKLATESDKRFVGNGLPKVRLGMTQNFNYKNWDASLSMRGAFGFEVFNTVEYAYGLRKAQLGYNVYKSAYTANYAIEDGLGSKPTTFFLQKGDYLKFDVGTIGYTINFKNLNFISKCRIYATGRNLFTIKAYNGVDPDIFPVNGLAPGVLSGINFYPSTLQVLTGVQIEL